MTCIERKGKKFCEVEEDGNTLYISVPEKFGGYPPNSWIAVIGIPPDLDACSSTHIFECSQKHKIDIVRKPALLGGQKAWYQRLTERRR